MGEVREYKTESKRLLELMINSIYTNKEIFLRELISNASDAIDKYHFLSLSDDKLERGRDYEIFLEINKKKRVLTITDNGIGMTKDELEKHMNPEEYIGCAPMQVDDFIENCVNPVLKANENELGMTSQINV